MMATDLDLDLEELWNRSAGRLLTAEVFDVAAFANLLSYLRVKAEETKDEHVISKQVLRCILRAVAAIDGARNPPSGALQLRNDLWFLLDLIAIGEAPSDRKPGVPRVT